MTHAAPPSSVSTPAPLRCSRPYDLQIACTFNHSHNPGLLQLVINFEVAPDEGALDCLKLAVDEIKPSHCPKGHQQKIWLMIRRRKTADGKRGRNTPSLYLKVSIIKAPYSGLY